MIKTVPANPFDAFSEIQRIAQSKRHTVKSLLVALGLHPSTVYRWRTQDRYDTVLFVQIKEQAKNVATRKIQK